MTLTNQHIEIDDDNFVHLTMVKRLSFISDEERASLSGLENVQDPTKFSLRMDRKDGSKTYIPTSVDEIASQGIALVRVSDHQFVPLDNIIQAKAITHEDRETFTLNTGRQMNAEFQSQIETKAGKVLSPLEPREVMKRMGSPYQSQAVRSEAPEAGENPINPTNEHQISENARSNMSMSEQREAVLKNAAPKQNSGAPEHPRER